MITAVTYAASGGECTQKDSMIRRLIPPGVITKSNARFNVILLPIGGLGSLVRLSLPQTGHLEAVISIRRLARILRLRHRYGLRICFLRILLVRTKTRCLW